MGRPFLVDGRALDHLGFCLMLNGAMEVEAGSLPVLAEAGDIVLLDLREPMRLIFGAQGSTTSVFTLWVPRARLPAQLCGRPALHGLLGNALAPGITVAAAAFSALLSQLNVVIVEELDELVAGVVALVGHAMSSCAASAASQPKQPAPLETLVTLCRYVEGNLTARDLGAEKLACSLWPVLRLSVPPFRAGRRGGVLYSRATPRPRPPRAYHARSPKSADRTNRLPGGFPQHCGLSTVLFALPMARRRGTYASERAGSLSLSEAARRDRRSCPLDLGDCRVNVRFCGRVSPIATIADPIGLSPACLGACCLSAPRARASSASWPMRRVYRVWYPHLL